MIDRYIRDAMRAVWSEKQKYDNWLAVELAVCEAWADEGVVPAEDMVKLRDATYDVDRLNEIFARTHHDMTAFTRSITERLGPEGRWIHLGLTSSDVIDTAQAIQLTQAASVLIADVDEVLNVLAQRALEHKSTLMMGRTHGIHAEPMTFGLKLALWWDEMRRNRRRLEDARTIMSVGKISGAVGTHATVSPAIEEQVCSKLGLDAAPVSNQVIQRDRHAQFVTTLAIVAASLEKFATEIRSLQRTEVSEVQEPFEEGQTGSSAMPHKRNPELSERICGLARLIRGHAVTALENVALWHERDISHSSAERLILPDSCYALDYILTLFSQVMRGLKVMPNRMMGNVELTRGIVFSQRVLLALVEKGMSREEAYGLTQHYGHQAWDEGLDFRDLLKTDASVAERLTAAELASLFDYGYYTRYVDDVLNRLGLA